MRSIVSIIAICLMFTMTTPSQARPQYVAIIRTFNAMTDREREWQSQIKEQGCKYCHTDMTRRPSVKLLRFQKGFDLAYGGKVPKGSEFKAFWAKDERGEYSEAAVELIRKAIRSTPD